MTGLRPLSVSLSLFLETSMDTQLHSPHALLAGVHMPHA